MVIVFGAVTKFPEAVPGNRLCSDEVVRKPLEVVAQKKLPLDIQFDEGIIFTISLWHGCLKKSGTDAAIGASAAPLCSSDHMDSSYHGF